LSLTITCGEEMTREIKIKICRFGKNLGLKDIIESVSYEKGDKNDIGDEPDDYVIIKLRDNDDVC
jgi:hypothetical protein